ATHLICMNILSLSFNFADGFGIAASSLAGQSLGAKRPDMAILYVKAGQRIVCCISALLCLVFIFGRRFLVSLFTTDLEVIELGSIIVLMMAGITWLQTSAVVISGSLRGAGDTRYVALTSLVSIAILRPFSSWLLCYPLGFGLIGAWFALFIDIGTRLVLNYWRFSTGKWTTIKV
ncbi:MAG: MATE family efflux transporter, partial [Lachnospiraceae bacterium]|nr:MATE family efflux transporter [Lachnospiraceae bacterium]